MAFYLLYISACLTLRPVILPLLVSHQLQHHFAITLFFFQDSVIFVRVGWFHRILLLRPDLIRWNGIYTEWVLPWWELLSTDNGSDLSHL